MNEAESKQTTQNQYIALFLVVLGLLSMFVGCHFHYAELTTAAAGVSGGGLGLLKGSNSNNSLRAGGGIAVTSPDPS